MASNEEDLISAFERQVALHPEREAVASTTWRLGYRRLDRTANRLAHWILDRAPAGPGVVALLTSHDTVAVATLLAALKAGKTALPLNPAAPPAVQRAILDDASPQAIFVDEQHARAAVGLSRATVLDTSDPPRDLDPETPRVRRDADAPALILFTSGSTGTPNGVLLIHRNVVANIPHQTRDMRLGCEDRITWLAPLHVAAAPSAIFCALLNGACVLPFPVASRSFRDLRDFLERERPSILHTSPSLFRSLCRSFSDGTRLPHVRAVRLAGEPVRSSDADLVARHFDPDCLLVNGFAMAETNGVVCSFPLKPAQARTWDVVPVGRAVPGVRIHLLDDAGRPVPPGDPGEIVVESERLVPCYWKQPALNEERFVRTDSGWRFLTRDLGRALPDGVIEHLGRKDDQVKVLGHRVRIDGLESVLVADPALRQACVTPYEPEPGRVMLMAHVVPERAGALDLTALRERLRERLPPHAVPSRFEIRDELPITQSGKIDRRSLARLAEKPPAEQDIGETPDCASRIADLWSRRLKQRCPSDGTSFFDLGGDSLSALEMLSDVEAEFGVDVRLSGFMESPYVVSLARMVAIARKAGMDSAVPGFVSVGPGRSGRPLFVAPGAASDPSSLLEVATELPERRLFVHSWVGIDGHRRPHPNVAEMADHFVEEMLVLQPDGPHRIAGISFGGVVAYEAARRLQRAGAPPAALLIVDTRLPGWIRPRGLGPRRAFQRAIIRRNPIGVTEEVSWQAVRRGMEQRRRIRRAARCARACIRRGRTIPHEHRHWGLLSHFVEVFRRWRPDGIFPGDATLFRAEKQPPRELFAMDETLGWRDRIGGELRIVDFPGGHGDFLGAPYAAAFAQRFGKVLEELDGAENEPGGGSDA